MSFLLAVLNASALCVAGTDICAPPSSTLTGRIDDRGGVVTITPAAPMTALGARFRAGKPVVVSARPWGRTDGARGFVVHVRGELVGESVISGAIVSGAVFVGQVQGVPSKPQLVEATDLAGGRLQVFSAGTVDIVPGTSLSGVVEPTGGALTITSPQPMRVLGLDFAAGAVRVHASDEVSIRGALATAQEIGGAFVDGDVIAIRAAGKLRLREGTLRRDVRLEALGLLPGTAGPGNRVAVGPSGASLIGPGPFTVCGMAVTPAWNNGATSLSFQGDGGKRVTLHATLVGTDVEVQPGLHLSGAITAGYDAGTCTLRTVEGTLAQDTVQNGVTLAAKHPFKIGEMSGREPFVQGTLAAPLTVDGITVRDAVLFTAPGGTVRLFDAILAKATVFREWRLPAGTRLYRPADDTWMFEAPRGGFATALAPFHGERVDRVIRADSSPTTTDFTLVRPHRPSGTALAFRTLEMDHQTGCVSGSVAAQRFSIFAWPQSARVTLCGGALVAAATDDGVSRLQVGRWFGTEVIAGAAGSSPPQRGTNPPPTGPIAGYWIQVDPASCDSGGPRPPPVSPDHWIWVDRKGNPTTDEDRIELASLAAKPGRPCSRVRRP